MVQRIPHRLRNRLRPSLELLPIRRRAGHIPLLDPRRTHRTPLVVVSAQPKLRYILGPKILGHRLGDK